MAKKILFRIVNYLMVIIGVNLLGVLFVNIFHPYSKIDHLEHGIHRFLFSLFYNEIHLIPFSPFLTLITLVYLIGMERKWWWTEEYNFDVNPIREYEWARMVVFSIVGFVVGELIFYGFLVINMVLVISCGFLIEFPYKFGIDWVVINSSFYFDTPLYWFKGGGSELFLSSFYSVLFLVTFYFSFTRYPNYVKSVGVNQDVRLKARILRFFKEKHQFLSKIYFVYLIYLSPIMIAWLYPVIRIKWLSIPKIDFLDVLEGRTKSLSNYILFQQAKIPMGFSVLAFLFISGLIITLVLIVRNNRKTWRINLKEELKNESNQII